MARKITFGVLLAALVLAYLALLHSPLRLAGDSPVYLCDATDLVEGKGFHDDHLPPGYPYTLAGLSFIGLGTSGGIVALNLVSIAVGLLCISVVLLREFDFSGREVGTICLLSCCSWMWIQLTTFPLSDLLFFALSSAVLALASVAKSRPTPQTVLLLVIAAALSVAAFFVRTIGAALFMCVALAVVQMPGLHKIIGRRAAIVLFAIGVVLAAGFGYANRERLASRWYAGALSYFGTTRQPLNITYEIAWWRIGELGELAQNVSSTAFAPTTPNLPIETVSPAVLVTLQLRAVRLAFGTAAVLLMLVGLWSRRRHFSPVEAYFLAYVGILLIWPYDDPRFFAPVLPLLFAFGWVGLRAFKPQARMLQRFAVGYTVVFCLFGAVALCDSLRVTYFDRQRPWRECGDYVTDIPAWLAAFDRYGGVRPSNISRQRGFERPVP